MRQSITILSLTVAANGAVTKRRAVGFDGAQADTAGQKVIGVAETDQSDGRDLAVSVLGTALIEAGAAFDAGDDLVVDTQGRAIVNPESGGEYIFADALRDAAGEGAIVEVLLRR